MRYRNRIQEEIRVVLLNYRKCIAAGFAEDSPIFVTLSRYSPLPGHTPEPVVVSGTYDVAEERAELSWTASSDADLVGYEVRAWAGPDDDADDESVLANILPGAPRTWTGTFGLGVPGAQASFRVYVLTDTGNERASNTLILQRPPV